MRYLTKPFWILMGMLIFIMKIIIYFFGFTCLLIWYFNFSFVKKWNILVFEYFYESESFTERIKYKTFKDYVNNNKVTIKDL